MVLAKFYSFLLLLAAFPVQSADIKTLEERHQMSICTQQGQEYEMKAVQAFWGDAKFMQECAPSNIKVTEPLTIYFEVRKDGELGELVITPKTNVASCIASNVKNRHFPIPPNGYVGKISLKFTK